MLARVRLEAHSLRFRVASARRVIAVIIAASLAAACSGGTAGDTAGPATSSSTTNTTTVTQTTSATAEDDGCDDWAVPNDLPIVDDAAVTVTADNHPLLADLRGEVPARYEAVVALSEPGGHRPAPPPTERNGDTVTALLAGLRANTTYTVEVLLLEAGCAVGRTRPVAVTSGSLPDALPPIVIDIAQPEAMHDGITLFNLLDIREGFGIDIGRGEEPPRTGWLVMVDEAGEIVWYHPHRPHHGRCRDARRRHHPGRVQRHARQANRPTRGGPRRVGRRRDHHRPHTSSTSSGGRWSATPRSSSTSTRCTTNTRCCPTAPTRPFQPRCASSTGSMNQCVARTPTSSTARTT